MHIFLGYAAQSRCHAAEPNYFMTSGIKHVTVPNMSRQCKYEVRIRCYRLAAAVCDQENTFRMPLFLIICLNRAILLEV